MDIFYAIEHSDAELLERLIRLGTDVNSSDDFGQTLLQLAIDTSFEEAIHDYDMEGNLVQPKMNIIEILLNNGADHLKKNNKGENSIDWAIERNNELFLIKLKESINKNISQNKE